MNTFIKKNATWLLLASFVLFCGIWFAVQPTPSPTATPEMAPISALTAPPSDAPSQFNVAPAVHSQLESLRARVTESPDDTTHVFMLARTLHDAHQMDEAAKYYSQYLDLRPLNREVWLDLAQCYGELTKWNEALNTIQGMLAQYPGDEAGRYNEGAIYANIGSKDKAQTIWHDLVMNGQDPEVTELARTSLSMLMGIAPR